MEVGPPDVIVHKVNPHAEALAPTVGTTSASSPILNHGGPVIGNTINVYVTGTETGIKPTAAMTQPASSWSEPFSPLIGSSPYYNINTSYPGVTGNVTLKAETTDGGSQGSRLSDADVQTIVSTAISSGKLASDLNGVYFVLTSSEVSFCGILQPLLRAVTSMERSTDRTSNTLS